MDALFWMFMIFLVIPIALMLIAGIAFFSLVWIMRVIEILGNIARYYDNH